MRLMAAAIAAIALPAAAIDFSWLTGPQSGKVLDREAKTPVAGAVVAGVFGESRSGWAGWSFHCQAIEAVTTDSKGEYRFSRRQRPYLIFAFKEGYWYVGTAAEERYPTNLILSFVAPPPYDPPIRGFETPLKRRLDIGRLLSNQCSNGPEAWKGGQPFYAALARDGAKSAATQSERLFAMGLCRDAANDGDDGGRVPGMNPRAAFTGLEATRLRKRAPECLAPALLAAKVNEGAGPNTPRMPIDEDDPRFLSVAIAEDPAASARRMSELNVITTGCRTGTDPEALDCCVGPASAGGQEAAKLMLGFVKEAGIPHALVPSGRGVCVRKRDEPTALDAAGKANAYLRNGP